MFVNNEVCVECDLDFIFFLSPPGPHPNLHAWTTVNHAYRSHFEVHTIKQDTDEKRTPIFRLKDSGQQRV